MGERLVRGPNVAAMPLEVKGPSSLLVDKTDTGEEIVKGVQFDEFQDSRLLQNCPRAI